MMRWPILALALMGCGHETANLSNETLFNSGYPPVRYQRDGVAAPVFFVNQAGVERLCGKSSDPRYIIIACAEIGGGGMVLPNPCAIRFLGERYAQIACHELGHNRGWPAGHGD